MKLYLREIQPRKVLAIAALGMAGFGGVAACASTVPASGQPHSPTAALSPLAPRDNAGVAWSIARIAVGNGGLAALNDGDGPATMATCDPGPVSDRPQAGGRVSASCGINYSGGSVWRQEVTVTFDNHGIPVADWTNLGAEVLPPSAG